MQRGPEGSCPPPRWLGGATSQKLKQVEVTTCPLATPHGAPKLTLAPPSPHPGPNFLHPPLNPQGNTHYILSLSQESWTKEYSECCLK